MKLVHPANRATLIGGDCLEVLRRFPAGRFDSVVTDPPYELGFMGKAWDAAGIAFSVDLWREVLRVLKPGGHLLAFGGTRTYHRMTCAIEDAGFEVRDSLHWFYGTGFPKSLNVAAEIDKLDAAEERRRRRLAFTAWMRSTGLTTAQIDAATRSNMGGHYLTDAAQPTIATPEHFAALRPLFRCPVPEWIEALVEDRVVVSANFAARPVVGQHANTSPGNNMRRGVLGAEPDPVGVITAAHTPHAQAWEGWGTALKPGHEPIVLARKPLEGTVAANVLRFGTGAINVDGCRLPVDPEVDDPRLGGAGTWSTAKAARNVYDGGFAGVRVGSSPAGRWPANVLLDEHAAAELDAQSGPRGAAAPVRGTEPSAAVEPGAITNTRARVPGAFHADAGGASRFFYVAKPSRAERDLGCDELPARSGGEATDRADDSAGVRNPRAGANRGGGAKNYHPTVKPIELMRYLVRLVTPPGGTVLDPFTGSGTTGIAARLEGFGFLGCERETEYLEIAAARIKGAA